MEVGTLVWAKNPDVTDEEFVWLSGEITAVEPLFGKSLVLDIKARGRQWLKLRETSDEKGEFTTVMRRNDEDETVDDLIRLTHLHEASIMHALVERFDRSLIYTYTGPILIAVNPFQYLDLYTDDILEAYYNGGLNRAQGLEVVSMEPHVYAIAANAYQDMVQRLERARASGGAGARGRPARPVGGGSMGGGGGAGLGPGGPGAFCSQSILISGESGSGKTVSTKHCLEYLTTVGQAAGDRSAGLRAAAMNRDIDSNKIVQSNPILEAFGNARTVRNDNSSRFGKLVEMHFGRHGELLGGSISSYVATNSARLRRTPRTRTFAFSSFFFPCLPIGEVLAAHFPSIFAGTACSRRPQTTRCHSLPCAPTARRYLLEKVRLCAHTRGERNFHIFYQLCADSAMLTAKRSAGGGALLGGARPRGGSVGALGPRRSSLGPGSTKVGVRPAPGGRVCACALFLGHRLCTGSALPPQL